MKRYKFIYALVGLLIFSSCEDFERNITTEFTEEQAKNIYENSLMRLNAIYATIPEGLLEIDGAMAASASDEAEHTLETSNVHKFNTGAWNAVDNPDNQWSRLYRGIRLANQFLESTDNINLDQFRLDPSATAQATYNTRLAEIARWKLEARFLRAYFYFELVKRYGGVPLFTTSLPLSTDFSQVERNSLQECIQFVVDECDAAAVGLLLTYANVDVGRITKGAALTLKAKMLLYAASELFNNPTWAGGFDKPELISLTGDRNIRWKAAADAAKAVIDLPGTNYRLHTNYRDLFINTSYNLPEIIFTRRNNANNVMERANYSVGFDQGNSGTTPSQNLVDAYEVRVNATTAVPFDWNNPTHASNPYANRDPRLGFTVIWNNSTYKGRAMEMWPGGLDGPGKVNASRTGYYLKKYLNESLILQQNQTSVKSWHIFRMADVYLMYAEALNEYSPGHADIAINLNRVRQRSGIAMPAVSGSLSQEEMRARIRHERRVEFAFEDQRRWDLRRWMEAEAALAAPLRGVNVTRLSTGDFTYSPFVVEQRVFTNRMYLYPIPQGEILISDKIRQNPGWGI